MKNQAETETARKKIMMVTVGGTTTSAIEYMISSRLRRRAMPWSFLVSRIQLRSQGRLRIHSAKIVRVFSSRFFSIWNWRSSYSQPAT